MKIYSWNVNGIRAAEKKGFLEWLALSGGDAICLQETKAHPDQLEAFLKLPKGYSSHWFSAQKAGYSSVAIYTRKDPMAVQEGMGVEEFDHEGRVLRLEFRDYHLISAYFPNSQRGGERLPYKLRFCTAIQAYCDRLVAAGKPVVLCGDFNIAHQAIDLRNPKANEKTPVTSRKSVRGCPGSYTVATSIRFANSKKGRITIRGGVIAPACVKKISDGDSTTTA